MFKSIEEIYTDKFDKENKDKIRGEFILYPNVTGVAIGIQKNTGLYVLCVDFHTVILIDDKLQGKKYVQSLGCIPENTKFEYRPKELTLIIG